MVSTNNIKIYVLFYINVLKATIKFALKSPFNAAYHSTIQIGYTQFSDLYVRLDDKFNISSQNNSEPSRTFPSIIRMLCQAVDCTGNAINLYSVAMITIIIIGYNIYHTALVSLPPHKFVPSPRFCYRLQDIKIYAFFDCLLRHKFHIIFLQNSCSGFRVQLSRLSG